MAIVLSIGETPCSGSPVDTAPRGLVLGLWTRVPSTELIVAARNERLVLTGAGGNMARLPLPLIIGEAEDAEAIPRLASACIAITARVPALS